MKPGSSADVLHELRRELLLQQWRLALAGCGGAPPFVSEIQELAEAETVFRRKAAHSTATTQDPRIIALLEKAELCRNVTTEEGRTPRMAKPAQDAEG